MGAERGGASPYHPSSPSSAPCSTIAVCLLLFLFPRISSAATAPPSAFHYGDALSKSLLYFETQRSGRLPYNQRVSWRDHSGLTDGLEQGVDLVGGYYDAGDHVKFGLPMAFTVTMLSWGVIEYGEQIADAGEYGHALEAIKWGTDYFIKAHTHPDVLWAEVGDGDTDHYCWQRPEDMTTSRQAYKIDRDHPGSDLAGETAAAMAAASIVFRRSNPHYSHLLLHHAQQLFEFGDTHRGKYDRSVAAARSYYASISGYNDELLWAALWLHLATDAAGRDGADSGYYLDYVVRNGHALGGTGWAINEFSWDIKYAGVQVLAAKLLMTMTAAGGEQQDAARRRTLEMYRAKAEHYLCSCLGKNTNATNVRRTPGGLLYIRQWNNMQYVAGATFLLTVYSDYLARSGASSGAERRLIRCSGGAAGPDELLAAARSQADYILGANPLGMSYLVGFGERYPRRVHHRAASMASYKESKGFIGCTQGYDDWYGRRDDNPNVLVGALVGGPDGEDRFRDERGNYVQTEACTYNTAPLVGVFAKLHAQLGIRHHHDHHFEDSIPSTAASY